MLWKLSPSQASGLRATQGFPLRVWPGPVGSRRNQTGRRCDDQPWWFVERAILSTAGGSAGVLHRPDLCR